MKRESNIELLRIVAMLLVVLVHANYSSLGGVKLVDFQLEPFNSFCKALAEQLCIICVNVFILISGWFGIRPSIKGTLSLLFQVFFFHILIVSLLSLKGDYISLGTIINGFYCGNQYWFIPPYLILYAISPILNAFIETSSPRRFLSVLIVYFLLEFALGWATGVGTFQQGYSTLSFIGLYLLAQFIRKNSRILLNFSVLKNILLYLFFSILPVSIYFLTGHKFNIIAYSSPFVISASLFFFLAFNKMKISSKVINYLACSSLSIYLVHQHVLVIPYFKNLMNYAYGILGGYWYVLFAIVFAACLGLVCILVDKLRICMWNLSYKAFIETLIRKFTKVIERFFIFLGLS